ncbi:protein Lines homolog 1 [Parasteatoda tepidariorum]|uniref:protein Lines homolog 1 n=1 Tax=Parasteatoda tepidariorum TaxID=114398 RepID=UPI00077F898B|nr:protein Lines homolog 1 [Parasteatoda tepidariorum]
MDYKNFWDESVSLYNSLEEQKCLCPYKLNPNTFLEISKACLEESDDEKKDCQLLCINMLRLLAETYVAEINKYQRICKEIQILFRALCKEDLFYYMVDKYLTTGNQHLSWSFAKTLSTISYGSPLFITRERINFIVKNSMLQSSDNKCIRLIELLSFIISPGLKVSHNKNEDSKCQNIVNCTLPLSKDHYISICSELILHWNKMVEMYSNPKTLEDKKEVAFLHLWRLIINGPLQDDVFVIFLNKKFILDILCLPNFSRPNVVSLYVEVIIKIISSNLKCRPWKGDDYMLIEKSVTTVLTSGLLESLSTNDQEFCSAIKKTSSCGSINMSDEVEKKIGAIEKKIIFILMNLLADFQNMQLLCESYQKIITFINHKSMLAPLWLVNMFLDDDDLLFGVMLASLRIYRNLQNENNIRTEQSSIQLFLLHDINPHALFIQLLQLLGCDHNEFISFLVSDETCCLLYLTEYLKLLLNEKDQFLKTYVMIMSDKKFISANTGREEKCQPADDQSKSNNEQAQCESTSAKDSSVEMKENLIVNTNSNNEGEEIKKNNFHLVTYSSSSSEDESCDESKAEDLFKIISVLINLKNGIQKLVNLKEFPYNISPLLFLLKSCEDLFR